MLKKKVVRRCCPGSCANYGNLFSDTEKKNQIITNLQVNLIELVTISTYYLKVKIFEMHNNFLQ